MKVIEKIVRIWKNIVDPVRKATAY